MNPESYVKKILEARVYDVAIETRLEKTTFLSAKINNHVFLKREDTQPIFSFKLRGAYNKMVNLPEEFLCNGVIAASAGNHAQGVALSAKKLGIKAAIVMPVTTPAIKVRSVKQYGAQTILLGDNYDEAHAHARELEVEKGYTFIHPYDDPDVIAGQGTIAVEILKQMPEHIDAIFVPSGGGGLIAGIAVYVKYLRPKTKIIAVEPYNAACLFQALKDGRRTPLSQVGIFADGVAVRQIGEEPFRIAQNYVDDVVLVKTDQICAAIKDIFEESRSIAEPAGALSVAGLKQYAVTHRLAGKNLVAIVSGANVNFDRLRHISERAEIGENREALLAVRIPEKKGAFKTFCKVLGRRAITEFNYRFSDPQKALLFVGVEINHGIDERKELIALLKAKEYLDVTDLTDNEMAILHVRHMIGGRQAHVDHELLYRFQFPERPGALLNFLNKLGDRWNISLFHYRNHGAAYGRVLAGVQVSKGQREDFKRFLESLQMVYIDESHNPAYRLFLK